jgi:flagellar biogenesis protein FliO
MSIFFLSGVLVGMGLALAIVLFFAWLFLRCE